MLQQLRERNRNSKFSGPDGGNNYPEKPLLKLRSWAELQGSKHPQTKVRNGTEPLTVAWTWLVLLQLKQRLNVLENLSFKILLHVCPLTCSRTNPFFFRATVHASIRSRRLKMRSTCFCFVKREDLLFQRPLQIPGGKICHRVWAEYWLLYTYGCSREVIQQSFSGGKKMASRPFMHRASLSPFLSPLLEHFPLSHFPSLSPSNCAFCQPGCWQ